MSRKTEQVALDIHTFWVNSIKNNARTCRKTEQQQTSQKNVHNFLVNVNAQCQNWCDRSNRKSAQCKNLPVSMRRHAGTTLTVAAHLFSTSISSLLRFVLCFLFFRSKLQKFEFTCQRQRQRWLSLGKKSFREVTQSAAKIQLIDSAPLRVDLNADEFF